MVAIERNICDYDSKVNGFGNPCNYITIHETDNPSRGAGARAHGNFQRNGGGSDTSWHYSVDDTVAVQSYSDIAQCWHAGSSTGNNQSIAIEICVNPDSNYNQAFKNAQELTKILMKRHGIPVSNVVKHQYWSGKNCPSRMINSGRWQEFLNGLSGHSSNTEKLVVDGAFGYLSVCKLQTILGTTVDGRISGQWGPHKEFHVELLSVDYDDGGSQAIIALQRKLGVEADGYFGPGSIRRWQQLLGVEADGYFGAKTASAAQRALNGGRLW